MKIAIDVGHARGTGAVGVTGENEHDVAARVAVWLARILENAGHRVEVIDFPEKSNRDDLNAAVAAVNAGGFGVCVSLHCDASDNAGAHGAHVCYYSEAGGRLAGAIAGELCTLLPGRAAQTVRRTDLAILKQTRPVAVLVEMGFITHAGDALMQRDHADLIAERIAAGLRNYFHSIS